MAEYLPRSPVLFLTGNIIVLQRILKQKPFNDHGYHMGSTAINHPVPDRVKLSFVIFDMRAP